MDSKPQKPPFLLANPFSALTELTFKLWGFGKPEVAVIPTKDAQAHSAPKRAKAKVRGKSRSKRARR